MVAPFAESWSRSVRFPRRSGRFGLGLGSAFLLLEFLSSGPGTQASSSPAANSPPIVCLTGGPQEGSTVPYRIEISWSGTDPNPGDSLHHYDFVIDPPSVFTPTEIAHPETSPTVTVTIRPGPGPGRDTVDVAKLVGGATYSFSWIGTPDTSGMFAFTTPAPEYTVIGGSSFLTAYVGEHRFLVRGQDTNGAFSEPDSVRFTARNHPPVGTIVYPLLSQEILDLGTSATVVATGTDAEPFAPSGRPTGYLTKLLRLDTLVPPISILGAAVDILYLFGDSTWTYHAGDTLRTTFPLGVPGAYIFGVRAVDEAAGVESLLAFGRNAFKFQAFPGAGFPWLTVQERITGAFSFYGVSNPEEAEVPAGGKLRFTWSAGAESYGGLIDAYSWGLDIPDPSQEGPGSGWSDWGPYTTTADPIVFPTSGVHTFYVRARDTVGAVTLATIVLNVIEMPFDREVLMVDDYFDISFPSDSQHDQFWRDMVSYYVANSDLAADDFYEWSVFGTGDRLLNPNPPKLSDLGEYKLLVWDNLGSGLAGRSGLLKAAVGSPTLAAYLVGGGKLWLSGQMTVGATMLGGSDRADLIYPKTDLGHGDFAYDFLKLHSSRINNAWNAGEGNLLNRAKTFPGFPVFYDTLIVDFNKFNIALRLPGGVLADAVEPYFAESEPDFRGNIDSLYVYGSVATELHGEYSVFQDKLCGHRWSDSDPDREQGRIQWFGFPMYYMRNSQAEQVFKKSLDWFREEEQVVPVVLLHFEAVRRGESAVVRWVVPEGEEGAMFHVYREEPGTERVRLTPQGLSGQTRYEFVDPAPPSGPAAYWLAERDRTGTTSWHGPVHLAGVSMEQRLVLAPVQPNPVVSQAQIAYTLAGAGRVTLTVYDVVGRQVATVLDAVQDPGKHSETWRPRAQDGSRLAPGFYLIRLEAGGAERVRKVFVLR